MSRRLRIELGVLVALIPVLVVSVVVGPFWYTPSVGAAASDVAPSQVGARPDGCAVASSDRSIVVVVERTRHDEICTSLARRGFTTTGLTNQRYFLECVRPMLEDTEVIVWGPIVWGWPGLDTLCTGMVTNLVEPSP